MKILVTGGAGFIGSAVVRLAISRGYKIVNLDFLTYAGCQENIGNMSDHPNYIFELADIRDRATLDLILDNHQPDAVMHLAAETHVDRSIDDSFNFIKNNILGVYNLLEAIKIYNTLHH